MLTPRRLGLLLALALTVGCVPVNKKGTPITGTVSLPLTTSCIIAPSPPWTLPASVTYPLGGAQHFFCAHIPTEQASTDPNVTPCLPVGSETPGTNQVDVWLRNSATPVGYYCARVSVPANTQLTYDYHAMIDRGWRAYGVNDLTQYRWIDGIEPGPGVAYWLAKSPDGACVAGACLNGLNWLDAHGTPPWIQVGGTQYAPTDSVTFYRVGCSPPTCD